jgi:glucokinase
MLTGAIDIGGTKIAVGIVAGDGRVVSRLECPTEPQRGFEIAFTRMCGMLRECMTEAGASIGGIGIGSTGPVDPFRGTIEDADLLPGWKGAPIVRRLSEEFSLEVAMENDGDAAALAEAAWGAGRGKRSFIYVTISTGIGAGIIVDGKLYRGVDGSHPELGHMVIDDSGVQCYCGARGCWEALASGPAMVEWMKANSPGREWTAKEICDLAEGGDELARRAVERESYYLGLGLANLVTVFSPDAIALGGGVMKSGSLFLEGARQVIRRNCRLVPHEKTSVVPASLGDEVGLAGAARVWFHRYR